MKRVVDILGISSIMFVQRIPICVSTLDLTPAPQKAKHMSTVNLPVSPIFLRDFAVFQTTDVFVWRVIHRRLVVNIRLNTINVLVGLLLLNFSQHATSTHCTWCDYLSLLTARCNAVTLNGHLATPEEFCH